MEINIEQLITEVFTRPVLWDQRNKNYHNRILADKNWKHIEETMKQSKEQLKKKWKCIRDQFRCEWKKIPIPRSGDSGITEEEYNTYTSWPHFKSLLFLKDQIKPRKSSGNLKSSAETTETSTEEILNKENLDDTFNSYTNDVDEYQDSEQVIHTPKKKKGKINSNGAAEILAIEHRKLQLLEKKMNTQKERNDDEAFFESLLPYMKNMDMTCKMLCRMEIQKVVLSYSTTGNMGSVPQYKSHNTSFSAGQYSTQNADSGRQYSAQNADSVRQYSTQNADLVRQYSRQNANDEPQYFRNNTESIRQYSSQNAPHVTQYTSEDFEDSSNLQWTYVPRTSPISPIDLS